MTFLTVVENLKIGETASQLSFQRFMEFGYLGVYFSISCKFTNDSIIPHRIMDCIDGKDRIYLIQWTVLPVFNLRKYFICHVRYMSSAVSISYSSRSCRMMFLLPSVICTLCTGFFCLAIIKGPPNDNYFIIEGPCLDYFTEKVSQTPFSLTSLYSLPDSSAKLPSPD